MNMNQETPVLSRGSHQPGGEFCLMEHVSVRAGLPWSDQPACTHRVLGRAAVAVNDRLADGPRQQLLALEDDLMTCPPRPELEPRLSVALGAWAARHVLPVYEARYPGDHRPRKAVEAAEAWLADGTAAATYAAADAAAYAYAAAAAATADAAADAAYATAAYATATATATATAAAAAAATAAYGAATAATYATATYAAADAAATAAAATAATAATYATAAATDAATAAADAADAAADAADAATYAYAAAAAATAADDATAAAANPADLLKELISQYQDLTARLTCGG
jgi:hypothetical protein